MTIEEMKNIVEQCKEDEKALIEINNLKFSSDFEFNFNDKWGKLFIRFCAAGISGIVASIDYNDIKSINDTTVELSADEVSTSV